MEMDSAALDRHITGNYGEDFFADDEEGCRRCGDSAQVEGDLCGPCILETDTEADWRYDRDEDRIREDAHLEQDFEDRYAGGEFDFAD